MPRDKAAEFIMKPKIDVAFKMLFGEESHNTLLSSLLSAIMNMPRSTFAHLEYLNLELSRFHINDKLGVLDVRVRTEDKKEINIEIQLASYLFMAKRSLFYWGKLFTSQIQAGDNYEAMEKCIVINIIDFPYIPLNRFHTIFHVWEDETRHMLDDVLEVHFLELPKLDMSPERMDGKDIKGIGTESVDLVPLETDEVTLTDWARFIRAESREELEALAKKNPTLEYAYEILKIASMDKEKKMLYEAREKQILDEKSIAYEFGEGHRIALEKAVAAARIVAIKEGREEGREEGIAQGRAEGVNMVKKAYILRMHKIGRSEEEIAIVAECSILEVEQIISGSQAGFEK